MCLRDAAYSSALTAKTQHFTTDDDQNDDVKGLDFGAHARQFHQKSL